MPKVKKKSSIKFGDISDQRNCYLLVWKHLWKLENGILSGVRFAMKNVHHLKFCFGIL